jgi:hypothetical protein
VGLRLRTVLAAAGLMLPAVLLPAQGAAAQEAPSISVTPSTGLADGETVTVTGGPSFPELRSAPVVECAEPVALEITSVVTRCRILAEATFDAEGSLVPTSITVREVFTASSGFVPEGPITFDCTVANNCSVGVFGFLPDQTFFGATTPIRFGPDVPATRADCLNGGWRNLANDQGQPFRNLGQCVSFVVAHRR